jgi:hypothetical protein
MKQANVIDSNTVEQPPPSQMSLQRVESGGALESAGSGSALRKTIDQVHAELEFVRQLMQKELREGEDYGKIPGTGDRPTLLQPGAQKLLMTFNLSVEVKREVLRDFPNYHREYEFTLSIKATNGKNWDGVGTCSTLEKKYRYRKGERLCPHCGAGAIIKGKAEYGGGWICFEKKGGCKAKFNDNDPEIVDQSVEDKEYENPADYWNTVRKMAYKRALVHGAITATNTSDLWTQDVEEMDGIETTKGKPKSARTKAQAQEATRQAKTTQAAPAATHTAPATTTQAAKGPFYPTPEIRAKMISLLEDKNLATEYFRKAGQLLPTEGLEELPLRFVPFTKRQMWELNVALREFGDGKPARPAFLPNAEKDEEKKPAPAPDKAKELPKAKQEPKQPVEVPRDKDAGDHNAPGPQIDPSWEVTAAAKLAFVSEKPGKRKNGEEYVRYGIKVGEDWYNTFSKTLGDFAKRAKQHGVEVDIYWTEGDFGRDIQNILEADPARTERQELRKSQEPPAEGEDEDDVPF